MRRWARVIQAVDTALPDTAVLVLVAVRVSIERTSQECSRVSCRIWVTMLSPERGRASGTHSVALAGVEITAGRGPSPGKPRYLPLHLALNLKFLFKN